VIGEAWTRFARHCKDPWNDAPVTPASFTWPSFSQPTGATSVLAPALPHQGLEIGHSRGLGIESKAALDSEALEAWVGPEGQGGLGQGAMRPSHLLQGSLPGQGRGERAGSTPERSTAHSITRRTWAGPAVKCPHLHEVLQTRGGRAQGRPKLPEHMQAPLEMRCTLWPCHRQAVPSQPAQLLMESNSKQR